jgi:hypothetical protein
MNWSHLSELPEGVRQALQSVEAPFRQEDAQLESSIAYLQAMRRERTALRIACLVRAALAAGMSTRKALRVVELHTGLSSGAVRTHINRRPKP